METRTIHCCECGGESECRLSNGAEVYPHRRDLARLPFWICTGCGNYVGCHHKTRSPTTPLGVIPSRAVRTMRPFVHDNVDPLWKSGKWERKEVYRRLSEVLGRPFHVADLRSVDECNAMIEAAKALR